MPPSAATNAATSGLSMNVEIAAVRPPLPSASGSVVISTFASLASSPVSVTTRPVIISSGPPIAAAAAIWSMTFFCSGDRSSNAFEIFPMSFATASRDRGERSAEVDRSDLHLRERLLHLERRRSSTPR
jgi:hypothetical protein